MDTAVHNIDKVLGMCRAIFQSKPHGSKTKI